MPTVKYTDFDLSKLSFSTPTENERIPEITKYQLMSIPSYNDGDKSDMPTIQGPWMTLDYYGIPSKTDKAGKPRLNNGGTPLSDRERGKVKVPFNLDNSDSKKLYEFLQSVDHKAESEKETIFGDKKKASVYKYQSIVRQPAEDPDAPEDAPEKPEYFVMKLDFDKNNNLKTKVFVNDNGERTDVNVQSLDDVTKYLRYKCEFRPIFTLSKLFSARASSDDGKRKYGFGLKLKMVEVKPMVSNKEESETFFIDTDDEGEERKTLVKETTKKEVAFIDDDTKDDVTKKPTQRRGKGSKTSTV